MKRYLLYVWVLILLGAVSCTKEEFSGPHRPEEPVESITLTAEEAERLPLFETDYNRSHKEVLALADGLMKQIAKEEQQTKAAIPVRTAVLSDSIVLAFPATKSATAQMPQEGKIYVVNFGKKAGFTLVAGDKRVQSAVLAYDGSGEFDVNTDNPGAQLAMELMKEYIQSEIERMEAMRGDSVYTALEAKYGFGAANNTESGEAQTKGYDAPYFPMDGMPGGRPDYPYGTRQGSNWQVVCNGLTWYWAPVDNIVDAENVWHQDMMTEVYPLIPAQWNQTWPYDVEVVKTYPGCPAGCVATAVAQIMRYHKKPARFMWDNYGYNVQANLDYEHNRAFAWESKSDEVIQNLGSLFFELGQKLDMKYRTTGSSAYTSAVPNAFRHFGYSTSEEKGYNLTQVVWQLEDKLPVYMSGATSDLQGHAWVIDGLAQMADYHEQYKNAYYQGEYLGYIKVRTVNFYLNEKYLHINWGWGGNSDGWYLAGTFNVRGYKFINFLSIITDIR